MDSIFLLLQTSQLSKLDKFACMFNRYSFTQYRAAQPSFYLCWDWSCAIEHCCMRYHLQKKIITLTEHLSSAIKKQLPQYLWN